MQTEYAWFLPTVQAGDGHKINVKVPERPPTVENLSKVAIAAEKAGIIKPEVPVVTSIQPLEAFSVIKSRAEAMSSRLIESERTVKILEIVDHGLEGVDVRFERNGVTLEVHIPLLGEHQIENTRTAIATLFELDRTSVPISPIAITIGSSAFRIDIPSGDFGRASTSSDLPAAIFSTLPARST